ncbi:MAG TPA: aldehyde dehydrogenase family protein [Candidatus Limnocylindrales bacterium]|nr:aldehyde dehydrogenase family protein [Candidatus Limnocylindrales bacterium]
MATTTTAQELGIVLGGKTVRTGATYEVRSPYDDSLVAVVHRAGPKEVEDAIARAAAAFKVTRKLPSWQRAEILDRIADGIAAARDDLGRTIALEAGKPIKTARLEADRAIFTFRVAAEEAKRIYGEIVPLDWLPGNENRIAHVRRVPLGPIAGITPFNFPLNLVAHKVAPALAAGNPIVLRPASQTPIASLKLAEIVLEAGWPEDGIAVVPSTTADASPLVEDDRIKLLTFTGSPAVGWGLKARAGMKRVTLELGGNAAVIVHADADADFAAERIVWGGTSYAGQTCISVQRVYAHESIDGFEAELVSRFESLVVGDPLDEATDVGPVIDDGAAERIESWLAEAVEGGARILTGGERDGRLVRPTLLAGLDERMKVSCEEVFGPIVGLYRYDDPLDAIDRAGASEFGLQAGLFTHDMRIVEEAFDRIEVGGLMVNDVSTYRVDHMPYGGVKQSGFGREGLRYAIEEMTELKLLTLNNRPRGRS